MKEIKPIVSTLKRYDGSLLTAYEHASGNKTYVLTRNIPGRGKYITAIKEDACGVFQKVLEQRQGKPLEVYKRAKDGSTIHIVGEKIKNFPNLVFNAVCETFFKNK